MRVSQKNKPILLPVLGTGIAVFFLRLWLFSAGVDNRGLLQQNHFANVLSFLLTGGVLLLIFLQLQLWPKKATYRQVFPKSTAAALGAFMGALGIAITVLGDALQSPDRTNIFCCVLGIPTAVCLVVAGVQRMKKIRHNVFLHGIVCLYFIIRLVCKYRVWSAEPQLPEYFFSLMASVFLMLTAYHRANLDYGTGKLFSFAFFHYGSLFFCLCSVYGDDWFFYLTMALWCLTGLCQPKAAKEEMPLPEDVRYCLEKLENCGFDAYVVGGCVRDSLLGLVPQDYDLCANATPEQIVNVFSDRKLVRNGEKHGTIGVVLDKQVYEITTFRTEGGYADSRHPDWVEFVTSLDDDLSRRDFTVNAMAYSPADGYVDLFGGRKDLQNLVLRTVGDPEKRFQEDALRILRGVRFAVRFNLVPEEKTRQAMCELVPLLDNLAKERIFAELCKILPQIRVRQMLDFAPILTRVIPALGSTLDFQQHSPHHAYDVYTHTAHTVAALPQELTVRLAGLLHDIGKPPAFTQDENGRGHFYSHAQIGAQMAEEVLLSLRAPTALREQVVTLIKEHMTPLEPDKKLLRRRLSKLGKETMLQLLALQKADYESKGVAEEQSPDFAAIQTLLSEIEAENSCLKAADLAVSGRDFLALGIEAGPRIGACMQHLLELVLDETIPNEYDALLQAGKLFLEQEETR